MLMSENGIVAKLFSLFNPNRSWLVVVCLVVIFSSASSVLNSVPSMAGTVRTYKVWTWNIAGWKMNDGKTTTGITEIAAASILNRSSDLVALNEICWDQYKDMQSRLLKAGWPQGASYSRFAQMSPTKCGGKPYGLAIFSKYNLSTSETTVLPYDGSDEQRVLLCAPITNTVDRFCTTHVTISSVKPLGYSKPVNEVQLDSVRTKLESYYSKGQRVIIAGDFNAQPNYVRLNSWYSSSLSTTYNANNYGVYRELDDTDTVCSGYGETTVLPESDADDNSPCGKGRKIDMIFVRANIMSAYSADSLSISTACSNGDTYCSDHRILTGSVTLK